MTPPKQQYQDLGPLDVIQGMDEHSFAGSHWTPVPRYYIGQPVGHSNFQFRRPIPASSEEKVKARIDALKASTKITEDDLKLVVSNPIQPTAASEEGKIDPVCVFHGKKKSEHQCLVCTLCFKSLTVEECSFLPSGHRTDVCVECAETEDKVLVAQLQSLTHQNEELKRENEKLSAVLQMANNNTRRRDNKIQSLRAELEQARKELSAAGEGQRARDDAPISAKSPQQSAAELVSDDSKSQANWLVSCWQSSHDIFPNLEGSGAERRYSDLRSRIAERLDAEHKLSDHLGKQVAALRNRNADLWRKINKDEQRKELIASNKANQRLKAECLEFREYANIHLKDLSAALSNLDAAEKEIQHFREEQATVRTQRDAATDELKKVREALRQIQILCLRPQQEDWPLEKRHLAGAVSAIAQSALNKQEGE